MYNLIFTSKIVSALSFAIGTMLFSLFLYFGESVITIELGIKFVIVAFLVNSILFIANLIIAIAYNETRTESLKTCGLMLFNVPIALVYTYFVATHF